MQSRHGEVFLIGVRRPEYRIAATINWTSSGSMCSAGCRRHIFGTPLGRARVLLSHLFISPLVAQANERLEKRPVRLCDCAT